MKKISLLLLWLFFTGISFFPWACSHTKDNIIVFTPVGSSFGTADLIDLEFLPGQGGESVVLGKEGKVYYVKSDFTPLAQTVEVGVESEDEQGLLNVAADPDYESNRFIYLYYTLPTGEGNQVDRFTVTVDTNSGAFDLLDRQTIITFLKGESPNFDGHHNGGAMVFDADGNLYIGVGDGGGTGGPDTTVALGQSTSVHLAKVHRIVPHRTSGEGGFSLPATGNGCPTCLIPEIYVFGLRNPFSLVLGPAGLFIGDVGSTLFEEVNLAEHGGENFGWPLAEGNSEVPTFTDPIQSYAHTDTKFAKEDPGDNTSDVVDEESSGGFGPQSVMVETFYTGSQYDGKLTDRLLYTDFFQGWVRGFKLDSSHHVKDDKHLGHQAGLTGLHEGPDGFLYGVALFGSDHILRVDLAP